jgi:hypothetical protein
MHYFLPHWNDRVWDTEVGGQASAVREVVSGLNGTTLKE